MVGLDSDLAVDFVLSRRDKDHPAGVGIDRFLDRGIVQHGDCPVLDRGNGRKSDEKAQSSDDHPST